MSILTMSYLLTQLIVILIAYMVAVIPAWAIFAAIVNKDTVLTTFFKAMVVQSLVLVVVFVAAVGFLMGGI